MTANLKLLASIPHLRLINELDVEPLRREVEREVGEYVPIEINYTNDSRKLISYHRLKSVQDSARPIQYYKTELYDRLPQTLSLVGKITRRPRVTRLSLLKAKSTLPWHNHYRHTRNPERYDCVIIQVPLINCTLSTYEVRDDKGNSYGQIYSPGEVWLFNSFYDHRVVNRSEQDRVSLFIETNVTDLNVTSELDSAVGNYLAHQGPIIS